MIIEIVDGVGCFFFDGVVEVFELRFVFVDWLVIV